MPYILSCRNENSKCNAERDCRTTIHSCNSPVSLSKKYDYRTTLRNRRVNISNARFQQHPNELFPIDEAYAALARFLNRFFGKLCSGQCPCQGSILTVKRICLLFLIVADLLYCMFVCLPHMLLYLNIYANLQAVKISNNVRICMISFPRIIFDGISTRSAPIFSM